MAEFATPRNDASSLSGQFNNFDRTTNPLDLISSAMMEQCFLTLPNISPALSCQTYTFSNHAAADEVLIKMDSICRTEILGNHIGKLQCQ